MSLTESGLLMGKLYGVDGFVLRRCRKLMFSVMVEWNGDRRVIMIKMRLEIDGSVLAAFLDSCNRMDGRVLQILDSFGADFAAGFWQVCGQILQQDRSMVQGWLVWLSMKISE
ncbi:hypothetical protein RYX36_031730 [Vicia faba]